jgi:hypothetical protein
MQVLNQVEWKQERLQEWMDVRWIMKMNEEKRRCQTG